MRDAHVKLEQHFSSLHATREESGRPVYLLEHGLSAAEVLELTGDVRTALKLDADIAGFWWKARFLPLLIVATESGYAYQGNGTDYWPLLENSLDFTFDFHQRRVVSEYFSYCKSQFNCVEPPETDWARSFCHIAWPIANAVLPLDMRLPFAKAIGCLNRSVRDLSDDELLAMLRKTKVQFWSQRYESWLATGQIAADLTRELLGVNDHAEILFDSVLRRIHEDLEKDASAHKALRNARRQQRALSRALTSDDTVSGRQKERIDGQKVKPAQFGRLLLRKIGFTSFEIVGEIPPPPKSSTWLERSLRSGLWRPQPWGLCDEPRLTPSEVLFSTPFKVPLRSLLAQAGQPAFFQDWSTRGPDSREQEWLEAVTFDYRTPLVFVPEDESLARQRRQSYVPQGTVHWVVVTSDIDVEHLPEGVAHLGRVGSLNVCQTDTNFSQASEWLESVGISAPKKVSWSWMAVPAFGGHPMPTYASDDFLAVNVQSVDPQYGMELVISTPGGMPDTVHIYSRGIYQVPTAVVGSYHVQLTSRGQTLDSWSYQITPDAFDCFERPICDISLSSSDYSTSSLVNRQLGINIATSRRLVDLDVEIQTNSGDAPVRHRIPESPTSFGPKHSIWDEIIGDKTRAHIARGGNLTLSVRVCGLGEQSWLLENEVARIHWNFEDDGPPQATTDAAQLETACWPLHQIFEPSEAAKPSLESPSLWVAMENKTPLFGSAGLIMSPTQSSMSTLLPSRPSRLLRQLVGHEETIGLKQIVEMYLCLSNARSTNIVAAFHCSRTRQLLQSWVLEACCGSRWIKALREQDDLCKRTPLGVLIACAIENKAGFVAELHDAVEPPAELIKNVEMFLSPLLPSRWWRLPAMPFGNNDGEKCDDAFARAYKKASEKLAPVNEEVASRWRTASPFTDIDVWRGVFQKTCEKLNGSILSELLFPLAGGDFLLETPLEGVTLDELSQLLVDWRTQFLPNHRSSEPWTTERFKVCLAIFLQPQLLRKVAWESPFESFVTDRISARAIAFVAWRVSQIEDLANYDRPDAESGVQ